jgi:hypothetical protein
MGATPRRLSSRLPAVIRTDGRIGFGYSVGCESALCPSSRADRVVADIRRSRADAGSWEEASDDFSKQHWLLSVD